MKQREQVNIKMPNVDVTVKIRVREWVLYLLIPIHVVQYLLGRDLWIPAFAVKTYYEK